MIRLRWFAGFLYWSIWHLSFSRGAWVADYEQAARFHPARKWVAPATEKQSHHLPAVRDPVVHER